MSGAHADGDKQEASFGSEISLWREDMIDFKFYKIHSHIITPGSDTRELLLDIMTRKAEVFEEQIYTESHSWRAADTIHVHGWVLTNGSGASTGC